MNKLQQMKRKIQIKKINVDKYLMEEQKHICMMAILNKCEYMVYK